MDLDRGARLELDAAKIPEDLHSLIPYVEKWGFESLEDQDAFVAEMNRERPEEVKEFNAVVDGANDRISQWGATLTQLKRHVSELNEEDWQHPYWSFLSMLKLREITGYDENDPEVLAAKEIMARERRIGNYNQATSDADEAFRSRDYARYVALLSPFEELLTPTQKKKLALAARRLSD